MRSFVKYTKPNRVRNIPVECLLNNYIEKEFQSAYRPFNLMDKLFLCPKFNIANSFITPTTTITNFLIVFGAILQILMHIFRFYYMNKAYKDFSKGSAVTLSIFINQSMFIITTIFYYGNTIIQSKNSVLLMIKLQQAFTIVDLEKSKILNNHRYWNTINVFLMCVTYLIYVYTRLYMAYYSQLFKDVIHGTMLIVTSLILTVPPMIFDMNIIYLTRTIYLIAEMLSSWKNKMAANEAKTTVAHGEMQNSKSIKSLYSVYMGLITAFGLCKNVFQISVSVYFSTALSKYKYNLANL